MPHIFRRRCNARLWWLTLAAAILIVSQPAIAQQEVSKETLFRHVRVLDVVQGRLSPPTNVLIRGNWK